MISKVELFALDCGHFEQLLRFTHLFPLIFLIREEGLSQPALADSHMPSRGQADLGSPDSSPPTRALQASFLPAFSAQSFLSSTSKEAGTSECLSPSL